MATAMTSAEAHAMASTDRYALTRIREHGILQHTVYFRPLGELDGVYIWETCRDELTPNFVGSSPHQKLFSRATARERYRDLLASGYTRIDIGDLMDRRTTARRQAGVA